MKITGNEARSSVALSRALKLAALGAITVSALACGDANPPVSSTPHIGGGGTSSTTGGSTGNAGTSPVGAAGTTPVSSGGGGATSTGGDTSVGGTTVGAGGTTPVTAPFCSPTATPVQTRLPLPFAVTTVFVPSGYEGGDSSMSGGGQLVSSPCADRAPGAIGACATYTYTPATVVTPPAMPGVATWAGIAYILGYSGFGSQGHAPVCLADGATAVTFYAKGKVGGETVTFSSAGSTEAPFVLTASWALYTIPMSGVQYNTDAMGLTDGFFFKIGPASPTDTKVVSFELDDIEFVGATGGGGAGGTGGAATGGGGAGGAASGGGGAGGTAAGSGGTGGA